MVLKTQLAPVAFEDVHTCTTSNEWMPCVHIIHSTATCTHTCDMCVKHPSILHTHLEITCRRCVHLATCTPVFDFSLCLITDTLQQHYDTNRTILSLGDLHKGHVCTRLSQLEHKTMWRQGRIKTSRGASMHVMHIGTPFGSWKASMSVKPYMDCNKYLEPSWATVIFAVTVNG